MALTMSQLRYRLEATDQAFRQTMQNATSRLNQLQETVNRGAAAWRNWSLAAAAAGTAVAYALRRVSDETARTASLVDRFGKQTGIATSTLQALGYAAEQEHANLETLGQGLVRLTRRTAEAAAGNQAYLASYRRLGIEIRDANGNILGTEELLLAIAEAFEGISDEGERARIAFNLLGDSGYALLPFLSMGRQEIERLMQEARDLGIIISRENIDRFVQYSTIMGRFRGTMTGLRNELAVAVIPIFNLLARRATEGVQTFASWVRENRSLVAQATIVTGALLTFSLGLKTVSTGILVVSRGIGLITSLIAFLTSPIGLVIGALGALWVAWDRNWGDIQGKVELVWDAISPILDQITEWEKRAIETTWDWIINGLNWMSEEFIPWFKSLPERIRNTWTWVVEGLADLSEAAALAVDRAVTWVVNLVRGAWEVATEWGDRVITWTVNLVRGAWEVAAEWVDAVVTWTVDLVRGSYEAVADWLSGSVTWVVDLARGTSERIRDWIDRVVEWTVNIARVTADTASRAAQWVLGLLEGRAEARTLTADVDLELQEAEPGWGDRLEAWLRRQLHGLEWQEIAEEEFLRLQEELGDQASQLLKIEDDRFFRRTPERLELAADFFLNLGNSVAGFIAGRTAYETLAAAARWLLQKAGWTWGRLATGALGWLLPSLGWTAAIMLALWAGFELLPEETQQSINKFFDDFFNTDLESYVKAALGAGAALLTGIVVGANALTITLAGALAIAVGLLDWDFVAAKIEPLWQKLREWYRGKEEEFGWEPGEHGVIRFGVRLLFDILGIQWGRGRERERQAAIEALRQDARAVGEILSGMHGPVSDAEREAYLQHLQELNRQLEMLGTDPVMPEDLTPAALEEQADAIERVTDGLDGMAGALATIEQFHRQPGMAELLRAIYRAEGSEAARVPFGMTAFADAGNRFLLESNRELFRQLIEATGFEEGTTEYYAAAASVTVAHYWERFKREFLQGADRTFAELEPEMQRRFIEFLGRHYAPPQAHPLNVHWTPNVMTLLGIQPVGMQEGGIVPRGPISGDWFPALLASDEAVIPADVWRRGLMAIARWFRRMGVPGYQTGRAPAAGFSVDVFRQEEQRLAEIGVTIETQGRTLLSVFRSLFTSLFDVIRRVIREKYPDLAEWIDQLEADIEAALTSVDEQFQQTFEAIKSGFTSTDTIVRQWTDNLVRGLSDAIAYGRDLYDVFDNFLRMLASRFIETRILGPLFNTFMPGVLGGLPVFHSGGLVLGGAGALVMHNGGIVPGLRSDERLIIAQTGERILSRTQNAAFERMLQERGEDDEPQEVTVNLLVNAVDAASFVTLAQRNPEAITTVVLHDILRNGDIRQAIRNVSRGG